MATALYPAVIERAGETYSVFFPDLPGCTTAGDTMQEAVMNAHEALSGHILEMVHDGEEIPVPSDFDNLEIDPEADMAALVMVQAELPGRSVRINVTMDEGLLAAIDKVAANRSGFLAQAAREALLRQRQLEDA
ncbi:type II toxin-antitoxin system HicB family antitoxin [Novosphingobium mangrovi (ex Huang et al. 2023)]|uniref:Type II toxin-antitoxin system HicB family antitoxin n=1 Tax=Novosphingobium mangrovi (ex Huang et al. 2023) TaxID=2976432 RepID=A0ABT2I168_9SPHN|nr:type II toxin-antitoxin system HicB family antitoxin [Novosphingobium mangrovi (ex Huang et al. 2023)]MCT2398544.1 type II toxin-antitoxin system HicB family antitoxin [Novosphingobium mangrovi (ex Huang et al. 2023)]